MVAGDVEPRVTWPQRPLVAWSSPFFDWLTTESREVGITSAIASTASAAPPSTAAVRQRQTNAAAISVPANSAAKLDCENDTSRPSHTKAMPATPADEAVAARAEEQDHERRRIATTRKRP